MRGGIGTHCYQMAYHWSASCDVTVIAPVPADEAPFRLVTVAPGSTLSRQWRFVRAVRRELRRAPVDLLYVGHWRATGIACRLARIAAPQPRLLGQAVHGSEVLVLTRRRRANALWRRVFRWATSGATYVALGSYPATLLDRLGVARDRVFVSPEGVDLDALGQPDPSLDAEIAQRHGLAGKRILLTVGRLVPRKGHDLVIQALPTVLAAVPNTVYLIVGAGPNEQTLRNLVTEFRVTDQVVFCGEVAAAELPAYYAAADVFVMPSRETDDDVEGFGIVFLEAAAFAKPSIGGRSGGVSDAIADGVTGVLVDPDSVDELAQALCDLLSDPAKADAMGTAAKERALDDFQYATVAHNILESVCAQAASLDGRDR